MCSCTFVLCNKFLFFSTLGHFIISIFLPIRDIYVTKFPPFEEIRSGGRDDCYKIEQSRSLVLAEVKLPLTAVEVKGAQSTEHLVGFTCPFLHPFSRSLQLSIAGVSKRFLG